ncbi:MAG: hypothetical protein PVF06_08450, partial [Gammaproteobacteria bacterium]
KSSTDNNPVNTAPYMKKKPDNSSENTHDYFIPAVIVLVLGVIIIATFYSKEFNNLMAGIVSSDEAEQLTSNGQEQFNTKSNAIQKTKNTGATSMTAEPAENTANVSTSTRSTTSSSRPTGTAGSALAAEKEAPTPPDTLASIQSQPAYPAYMNNYAAPLPYAPPPATYTLPGEWNAYNELMMQRRRQYEQAQHEHLQRIHEYQAALMKRIEQDREDMLRHMQELAQESQRRRDAFIHRLNHFEKTSIDRPI